MFLKNILCIAEEHAQATVLKASDLFSVLIFQELKEKIAPKNVFLIRNISYKKKKKRIFYGKDVSLFYKPECLEGIHHFV